MLNIPFSIGKDRQRKNKTRIENESSIAEGRVFNWIPCGRRPTPRENDYLVGGASNISPNFHEKNLRIQIPLTDSKNFRAQMCESICYGDSEVRASYFRFVINARKKSLSN